MIARQRCALGLLQNLGARPWQQDGCRNSAFFNRKKNVYFISIPSEERKHGSQAGMRGTARPSLLQALSRSTQLFTAWVGV